MRVGLVQMRSTNTVENNISEMDRLVRLAVSDGATYVQTPEMTGILEKSRKHLFARIVDQAEDKLVAHASQLARELGVWLHIGSHAVRLSDEKAANRAFVFSPDGALATTYDKIHMFDVDLDNGESWRESKVYAPGDAARVFEIGAIKFGLSICYDLRFPHLYRQQASAGATLLTVPAAFTRQTGEAHWHALLKARAIENGAFVLAAAQGGRHDDGRETYGNSLIVSPWGEIVSEIPNDEPGVVVADLDLSLSDKARRKVPNLQNSREFTLEIVSSVKEAAQ